MPKKTCLLQVRMTPQEKQELKDRIGDRGFSDYIRSLIALDKKEGYVCRN